MTSPAWGVGEYSEGETRGMGVRVRMSKIRGETNSAVLHAPLRWPAVLNAITIAEEFPHADYDTEQGSFSTPAPNADGSTQAPQEFDLETLRLDADAPWLVEFGLNHELFVDELEQIGRWRTPFSLLVVTRYGQRPEFHGDATIRRIEKTLKPGEADTRYITVGFKAWRSGARTDGTAWVNGRLLPTTIKLKSGDTFRSLARKYYGSATDWRIIRNANGFKRMGGDTPIVNAPHRSVGDKILIPNPNLDSVTFDSGGGLREGGV